MDEFDLLSDMRPSLPREKRGDLIVCEWFDHEATLASAISGGGGNFYLRAIREKKSRPEVSAVYLMTWGGIPLYVGQTTNLRKRWSGHRMSRECKYLVNASIIYSPITENDPCDLLRAEFSAICRFRPLLQRRLPDDRRAIRDFIRNLADERNPSGFVIQGMRRFVETSHSLVEVPNG